VGIEWFTFIRSCILRVVRFIHLHHASISLQCHDLLQRLNDDGRSATTSVADASATDLALLLPQYTEQCGCNPSTGSTERMAERNGSTVEVDLVFLDAEDLHVGKSDDTERLVDLERIDGGQLNLGVLQGLGHGESRSRGELGRVLLRVTPAEDLTNGLKAVLLNGLFGGKNEGSSAVRER
jgi:hypothetical protein